MPVGASGSVEIGRCLLGGLLDPPLDLAHIVEILVDAGCGRSPGAVVCSAEASPQHRIQQARPTAAGGARRSASVPPSPNSRSKTTCGLFCIGSGAGRTLPGKRVPVGTAEAVPQLKLASSIVISIDGQRRVLADVLRGELVERDAQLRLRAGLRMRAAQERRGGAVVIGCGRPAAVRLRVTEIADDIDAACGTA